VDGVVVTNYHVIADCEADSIKVYFPDGQDGKKGPFPSQLIAEEPERDLALLHIDQRVPKVEIDTTHKFRRGQDVVIIGSPGVFRGASLLQNAVTTGVLSSETVIEGYNHYQLSLAVNGGNSGGPVFGMDARVIGVVVSKSTAEDSISFCIPASDLVAMLQAQANTNYKPTGRVEAEHNARVTVNALTSQVISLDKFMNNVSAILSERSGKSPELIAANDIVIGVKSYMEKEAPELVKDYSFSLKQIVDDERLTARQRSEVESLMQRHRALKRIFDQPPPNVRQLTKDLRSLRDQFLNQLAAVNRSLQLGKPGAFN
jgi:serine protease Do